MADAIREENPDPSTQRNPDGAITPSGTPPEWSALEEAFEAKRARGDPVTQPAEWTAIDAEWTAIDAEWPAIDAE